MRHRFSAILFISVCAVAARARSFAAIAEWAADTATGTLTAMGIGTPDASTIRRALSAFTGDGFDTSVGAWFTRRLAATRTATTRRRRRAGIAVDGIALRGARIGQGRTPMVMAALDHVTGVVLGQVAIGEKSNEIPQFSTLLDTIDDLADVVVTADALHAQTAHADYLHRRGAHADYLHRRGAHYVLTVKGNRKTLRAQLAGQPWKQVPVGHRERDTRHGRTVTRTYRVITIEAGIEFPHAAQTIQITRTRKRTATGKRAKKETLYAVTSLTAEQAQPAELAAYVQDHWHVENKLHWVRDVTMGEDASRIRTGGAPRLLAGLRNLVLSLLRLAGHTNIAKALRHNARHPIRAIELALTS